MTRFALVASTLIVCLACAGRAAGWYVDGEQARGSRLAGAVMDGWGGDPGPICFTGSAAAAEEAARKAFTGTTNLVSTSSVPGVVTITTRSPFGDGKTSATEFRACP